MSGSYHYCSEFSLFCILCQEFWEESTSSRGGLGSGVVGVPDSRPTLDGAVLHDFTIGLFDMRSLCWITCIFDENTLLYTLCICVLCRSKANNCGYIVI